MSQNFWAMLKRQLGDLGVHIFMGRLCSGWNSCYSIIHEHVAWSLSNTKAPAYSSSKALQWSMQLSKANDQSKSLCLAITLTIFSASIGKADIILWNACMSEATGVPWGIWSTLDG